jgi:hypothetical protein
VLRQQAMIDKMMNWTAVLSWDNFSTTLWGLYRYRDFNYGLIGLEDKQPEELKTGINYKTNDNYHKILGRRFLLVFILIQKP